MDQRLDGLGHDHDAFVRHGGGIVAFGLHLVQAVHLARHLFQETGQGGLIHRMPLTSFVFLVGCVAISALPPFNGFVSE